MKGFNEGFVLADERILLMAEEVGGREIYFAAPFFISKS